MISALINSGEREALMWATAEIGDRPDRVPSEASDPLLVLLAAGYARDDIMKTVATVEEFAHEGVITEPLSDLQKDILRVAIENSSWLEPYKKFGGGSANQTSEKRVLREFAKKLEAFGIEISFIPNN